jgi:hypothetical protein
MGYWGMVSDEKEGKKWRRELMDALKKENSEDYLVAIDCHI